MAGQLQLVLVTPETTLFDEPVSSLRFPLFDGQIGVLPGRAPMVGRLGYGELKISADGGERTYFIDGGFVQVAGDVVSLLTNRALTAQEIDPQEAETMLSKASASVPTTDLEFTSRDREQERARRMLEITRKPR